MPVFVDHARIPYRGMLMCHMVADTDAELHAMAARIGIARRWHQRPGTHLSHYDICISKRKEALAAGAIPISRRELALILRRKRAERLRASPDVFEREPMRIGVASDIHLEKMNATGRQSVSERLKISFSNCDLVLLAGDIDEGVSAVRWAGETFRQPVCLVAGNHEYWNGEIDATRHSMAMLARHCFPHVHFLHDAAAEFFLGGQRCRVVGSTLWTDMELFGDQTLGMLNARRINDYERIFVGENGERRLITPADVRTRHLVSRSFLEEELLKEFTGRTIVLTHHAPSQMCIGPTYMSDPTNTAFASNLEHLVAGSGADLWVYGHTHHNIDVELGTTRLVAGQVGTAFDRGKSQTHPSGIVIEL